MTPSERKEKARWARIKRVYGLTQDDYNSLWTNACPICLRPFDTRVRPCVDHDHKTGEVRGILCLYCNRWVIGKHRDPLVFARAYDYLRAPRRGFVIPPKNKKRKKKRGKRTK